MILSSWIDLFPISYSQGASPQTESEIAISSLYASDFNKTVGDEISLMVDGQEKLLTVCGIYSDMTNNGKTAKAIFEVNEGEVLNCSVFASLTDLAALTQEVEMYQTKFPSASVICRRAYRCANSKSSEEIMGLLVNINKEGTAILLVTHDSKVAARADRILFTKDGNIVSELVLILIVD